MKFLTKTKTGVFFVSSYYLNSEYLEKYSKPFDTHNLNLEKMDSICKKKINKK